MRQLTEQEHERLLQIERAYRRLQTERRPYVKMRRWIKNYLITAGQRTEFEAERIIFDEIEGSTAEAALLRKPSHARAIH